MVEGRGEKYSGQWNCSNREEMEETRLSALHSDDVSEDGEPYLAEVQVHGAEVVAWDAATGAPMLLNTDWTEPDNTKEVMIVADHKEWKLAVRERTVVIAEISDGALSVMEYML